MRQKTKPQSQVVLKIIGISCAGFLLSFVSLYLFMYLFENVFTSLGHALDFNLTHAMYMFRTSLWTDVMLVITSLGADVSVLGVFIVGVVFSLRKRKKEAIIFAGSVFIGLVLSFLLKAFFQRLRPDMNPLLSLDSYSYPSTHAMNAFIFYGLLAFYLIKFTKRSILEVIVAVLSAVLVVLIGLSRIYLGVHYPTDVLAGYMAGFWIVVAVIEIDKIFTRHTPVSP